MDETEGTHSQRATGSDPESLSPTQLLKEAVIPRGLYIGHPVRQITPPKEGDSSQAISRIPFVPIDGLQRYRALFLNDHQYGHVFSERLHARLEQGDTKVTRRDGNNAAWMRQKVPTLRGQQEVIPSPYPPPNS